MPLPDQPLTLHGGCNCQAVRYRIQIPSLVERPLNPSSDGRIHYPVITTDHCDDCRRATGSVLPFYMMVPATMMSCQLQPIANNETASTNEIEPWVPVQELFRPGNQSAKYWLKFFHSSWDVTRTFCGRCGTNLTFSRVPMPEGYPDIFDVLLGSIDKEDLQMEYMAPDRHCWVSDEIEWVKVLTSGGRTLPRHPRSQLIEVVD